MLSAEASYSFEARASLPGLTFSPTRAMILDEAKRHALAVLEDGDGRLTVRTAHGLFGLRRGADARGVDAIVAAADARWLFVLKNAVVEQLGQTLPAVAQGMRWSDGGAAGSLPPNFQFMRVQSVEPVGSDFLRVRVQAEDLSRFGDDAIHFRLVLAPRGAGDAEWPTVGENGAIVWPQGEKALHRPVYTTRWLDREARLMDFDVFVHDGGRVTEWARKATGQTVTGLTGPGGGGIPQADRILMFADETGFPAVARILEALPVDTIGAVTLVARNGARCGYPVEAPQGVSLRWVERGDCASMAETALAAHAARPDHFLWFVGERQEAMAVRARYKDGGGDPARAYVSAYWRVA